MAVELAHPPTTNMVYGEKPYPFPTLTTRMQQRLYGAPFNEPHVDQFDQSQSPHVTNMLLCEPYFALI
jgi:hypothetical protein